MWFHHWDGRVPSSQSRKPRTVDISPTVSPITLPASSRRVKVRFAHAQLTARDCVMLLVRSGDHTVKLMCCRTGRCVRTLEGHRRTPWVVRFHPTNPSLLVSGSLDHEVRLWNVDTAQCIGCHEFGTQALARSRLLLLFDLAELLTYEANLLMPLVPDSAVGSLPTRWLGRSCVGRPRKRRLARVSA